MFYNFIGFLTLIKKETRRYMKVYIQALLAPLFSNLLFLGIFGAALRDRSIDIPNVDYLSFILPGLCLMGASLAAFSNPSSSIIIQKYNGTLQDINSYPLTSLEKTLAYVLSATIRGIIVGIATLIASIPFLGWQMSSLPLFILHLLLATLFFSAMGLIAGLIAKDFEYITFLITFIITPLAYFGGVFFEIKNLPQVFQYLSLLNPLVPMVSSIRYSYLGFSSANELLNFFIILILTTTALIISNQLIKKGVGLISK
jgi:ABC-2 type transport system permease protein